jgi:hypothetical protein
MSGKLVNGTIIKCASWCGCGCTLAAFDRATAEAAALCARLGPRWKPSVWENTGWHYRAVCGLFEIYPNRNGSSTKGVWDIVDYTAMIQTSPQFIEKDKDPLEAVRAALGKAQALFDAIAATCRDGAELIPAIRMIEATP